MSADYTASSKVTKPISREELSRPVSSRVAFTKNGGFPNARKLWGEGLVQVAKEWLPEGISSKGKATAVNPTYRFAVQQSDKHGAVDSLKRGSNEATAVQTPINLPSWGYSAQMRDLVHFRGERRPLAMTKVDYAEARNRLRLSGKDGLVAAVTLRSTPDGLRCGFVPRTQLFGSPAAILPCASLSWVIASLVCRFSEIPCVGYPDDSAISDPRPLAFTALRTLTAFNDEIAILLKKRTSEADSLLEFLGLAVSLRGDCEDVITSSALSKGRVQKIADIVGELGARETASFPTFQKVAGILRLAQTAVMGYGQLPEGGELSLKQ